MQLGVTGQALTFCVQRLTVGNGVVKFTAYEQAGIAEYWIANPKTKSVQVYTLSGQEYALVGEFVGEEKLSLPSLPGLEIVARSLF